MPDFDTLIGAEAGQDPSGLPGTLCAVDAGGVLAGAVCCALGAGEESAGAAWETVMLPSTSTKAIDHIALHVFIFPSPFP